MICKKCHPVMRHKLIQSGRKHPRSYICSVCGATYDDYGNLHEIEGDGKAKSSTCPHCGSTNIAWSVMGAVCMDCGKTFVRGLQ